MRPDAFHANAIVYDGKLWGEVCEFGYVLRVADVELQLSEVEKKRLPIWSCDMGHPDWVSRCGTSFKHLTEYDRCYFIAQNHTIYV